jgi:superfamily II DNA or RNA helicase
MIGLYIISCEALKLLKTLKIGMSMRLNERVYDYDIIFKNTQYLLCYEFLNDLTRQDILEIEKIILDKTINNASNLFQSEYRQYENEEYVNYLHELITNVLHEHQIIFNVLHNPKFEKPENNKVENLNNDFTLIQPRNIIIDENLKERIKIQSEYIKDILNELKQYKKVILNAPTGLGKTIINFKTLNILKPNITIIFTPRIDLNNQCFENKYTNFLDKKYKLKIFNDVYNIEQYDIIVCCYQSSKKLYKYLFGKNIIIDLLIYDEAHYINSWTIIDNHKNYFLTSNEIKNRIFTTATPKIEMINNKLLFGNQVENIKLYECFKLGIACNIKTMTPKINEDKKNIDLCNVIIQNMNSLNRKKCIVYTNTQNDSKILYDIIKKNYNNTFIWISNIQNDDLNIFSNHLEPSIIISCCKIGYGYDNIFIDFICFADVKNSYVDIVQSIGRGIRNNLSIYPNKELYILIPIYKNELREKFLTFVNVMNYLISEGGYNIVFQNNKVVLSNDANNQNNNNNFLQLGTENIPVEIYNELSTHNYNLFSKFVEFLKSNNVYDKITYEKLKETNIWMVDYDNLKIKYPKFCFRDLNKNSLNYYWTKDENEKAIEIAKNYLMNEMGDEFYYLNLKEQMDYFVNYDKKIMIQDMNY